MSKIFPDMVVGGFMSEQASKLETQALICRVKDGDSSAFTALLERYAPLIEAAVLRCLGDDLPGLHADDLRQDATVVFYNSILAYDIEQHEVEFGLYAKICISNALISQLRRLKKRRSERLSDTSEEYLFVDDLEEPSIRILEQESLKSLYSVIKKNLSNFEYRVLRLYVSGKTAKQIGVIVSKDEKSVTNAIYRIRKKLRALLHKNN